MWIEKFQMFKLDLEKPEEPEVKLPKSAGSSKKQENSRKPSTSSLTKLNLLTVWITSNCGKFFKRWEYQTTLPASWGICMQVRKQQLELDMAQQTGSKSGKGVHQGCILSPFLFNLYAVYIMRNTGLEEAQAWIKIAGRSINNLRYADDTTLMAETEEEQKASWWKWKKRVKKLA